MTEDNLFVNFWVCCSGIYFFDSKGKQTLDISLAKTFKTEKMGQQWYKKHDLLGYTDTISYCKTII